MHERPAVAIRELAFSIAYLGFIGQLYMARFGESFVWLRHAMFLTFALSILVAFVLTGRTVFGWNKTALRSLRRPPTKSDALWPFGHLLKAAAEGAAEYQGKSTRPLATISALQFVGLCLGLIAVPMSTSSPVTHILTAVGVGLLLAAAALCVRIESGGVKK